MAIQGYDKTSTYSSIATGNVIEASYFTNEFAELFNSFAKTSSTTSSGHRHDGGDAMGGYLSLLSDSDNDTKISVETISISSGAPSYTDSDTITIIAGNATIATIDSGDINVAANKGITFGDDGEKIEGDGTDLTITGNNINLTATADVNIPSGVGLTFATAEKIESDGTDLSITVGSNGDINIPANIGLTFGDDGEKIEGDGTDLTISGNNINLTAVADVNIPSGVGITFATAEKIESDGTDLTITVGSGGDINIPADIGVTFGNDGEKIEGDGTDLTITGNNINLTATADVVVPANVGITFGTGEKIEGDNTDLTVTSGADINLTATSDVNIPANVGITFGDDGEKIEGDGTDLTVSASADLNLTATTDINIPANVGLTFGDDGEKIEGDGTDLTVNASADLNLTATTDINIPANVGLTFGDDGEKIEGDGTDLTISSSAILTIDAGADIVLDAGGANVTFKDDGTAIGDFSNSSSDFVITSSVQDKDIVFKGDDGGSAVTALTLDMSDAGAATFNNAITSGAVITSGAGLVIADAGNIGSASDTDAIAISSTGVVTFSQVPLLPNDTIETADIQDNAVTLAKMAGLARGKLIIGNASGDPTALAAGSANYVLTSDGTDIAWAEASGSSDPSSADGDSLGTASAEWSDLYLADGGIIYFGNDQDVTVTHDPDDGLFLKSIATGDDNPFLLTLQTGETDIAANDVIGKVAFQAPDEGTGTDAILVAAAIQARSEGDFSSSSNATSIDFMTGASEAATTKWSITSAGSFLNAGTNTIDMNAGELILDADQDTSITADTDDQIDIRIAGADDFQFTANTFTVLSGSTLAIASGATIANSGTATGFGGAATSAKTAAYTVIAADDGKTILCSAASADYEVALTAAGTLGDGFSVTLKKSDATKFMITINPNGSETIDGLPDLKLRNEHSEVTLVCDGSNWHIISHENVAYEYNAIDNSNFQVDQYSQSVTRTALGSGSSLGIQDRWKIAMSGSPSARFTYSVESSGGVDGRQKWAKLLCTTANASPDSNDQLMLRHNITGNNLVGAPFLGTDKFVENMVLSFDIIVHLDGGSSESFPVKMGVNCFTGDSTAREIVNDVSVAAADTWERVSIVIPQDTAANWSASTSAKLYFNWNLTGGSGSVGTENTWANTSYTDYITSNSSNFADAANNYVGITNVKLQPGQIATPYIPRTYEEELTVCKFYAELLTYQTAGSQIIAFGTASGTGAGQVNVTYQEKRAAPAVTGSAAGTFQLSDYNGGGTNDATGVSWNEPGLTNVRMSVSYGGTAFTVNDAIRVNRDGSDAAFIFINAEV
jgi:hypothetical protein